ncbi:hypothetical protein NUACC21_05880 [Scytonema sp. NUACC21]
MYIKGAVEGAANTESGSRIFVYEVVGLRQSEETDKASVLQTASFNRTWIPTHEAVPTGIVRV